VKKNFAARADKQFLKFDILDPRSPALKYDIRAGRNVHNGLHIGSGWWLRGSRKTL